MSDTKKQIDVAVGVIEKDREFFVCLRKSHQHQGDKWEFPGGKVDAGETPEQALYRELKEEIAIEVQVASPLMIIDFEYPEKVVKLHIFIVSDFSGSACGAEGQVCQWLGFEALSLLSFPDANRPIIDKLRQLGY